MTGLPPTLRAQSAAEVAERLQADRRGLPYVLYRDGDGRQRIVALDDASGALRIGRDADSDVALDWDREVSRVHAVLEPLGREWTLVDDGLSRNGSFVNGERVRGRRRLRHGDRIAVGGTVLAFHAAGEDGAGATETTRLAAPPELSAAQRRVLQALCAPVAAEPFAAPPSNREIAEALFLSVETVKTHLHALFERFEVGDMPQNRKRAELVRRAFERGALPD